jgi:acetylserotonin O-methyltransferase
MVEGMEADSTVVLDLIEAFRRSKTMFCAVSLGVFDFLAEGSATAITVGEKLGTDQDAMERLLEACTGLKLLQKQGDKFSNTAAAQEYLCRNSKRSMTGYILYSNNVLFPMWSHLEDAVREGTHRWQQTFGSTGPLFSSFFPTEEKMRTFIMGMHGFGMLSSPAVTAAIDLSHFRQMVDLGGATGHLTVAACERYPLLRGIVFDFPEVLQVAREQITNSSAHDRIQCVPGNFFTDPLPQGDLYALGRILHDWSAAKIEFLLKKIYQQLPAGGALLIAEKLLDEDKLGPVAAQMQSLNMLVVTEGKERSLPEYEMLLKQVGFREIQGVKTGKPIDLILAYKR